jgi:hypothetical protein
MVLGGYARAQRDGRSKGTQEGSTREMTNYPRAVAQTVRCAGADQWKGFRRVTEAVSRRGPDRAPGLAR